MTLNPVMTQTTTSLLEAAKLMEKYRIGSLLVLNGDMVSGIITVEDLVYKAVSKGLSIEKTKIVDIMASDLITVEPEEDIFDALSIMSDNEINQLPVMRGNKLVGFLTRKDILKIEPQLFDLIVEQYELREEERKMQIKDEFSINVR